MDNNHLFYRACDDTCFMDGTPEQNDDDVYEAFNETYGHYPTVILSVNNKGDSSPFWEDSEEEEES